MKLRKISAVAASAVAAAALAASANAALVVPETAAPGGAFGTGNWMIKVFCPSEGIDNGIDWSQLGSFTVTTKPADPDWWEGQTGGALYVSCGPTSITPADHNWVSSDYWGVIDEDLELETLDTTKALAYEALGDYTYSITLNITDDNCVYPEVLDSPDGYIQIGIQEWGSDMSDVEVISLVCYDKSGAVMATFDGSGNMTAGTAATTAAPAATEAPAAETTSDVAATTATAGDTTAAVTSSKGSPDTGIADVAAVAGIAVVAAGALVVAKKRG